MASQSVQVPRGAPFSIILLVPMTVLKLEKQHFAVDYAPLLLGAHKVELWRPAHVDLYLHYRATTTASSAFSGSEHRRRSASPRTPARQDGQLVSNLRRTDQRRSVIAARSGPAAESVRGFETYP